MAIPMLDYAPSCQNQRVSGFDIGGDEQPRIYTTNNLLQGEEMSELIRAAYQQVFHEQQILASNRQEFLESQLKSGQITVKDFVRGLACSASFRELNYEPNNNYRFVQICIQRLLGRDTYSQREQLAWSTILATKGLKKFIEALLDSQEYADNFGDDTVPYQRRRILPQQDRGSLPFTRTTRYSSDYLVKLKELGYDFERGTVYYPPQAALLVAKVLAIAGALSLSAIVLAVALAAWGFISL